MQQQKKVQLKTKHNKKLCNDKRREWKPFFHSALRFDSKRVAQFHPESLLFNVASLVKNATACQPHRDAYQTLDIDLNYSNYQFFLLFPTFTFRGKTHELIEQTAGKIVFWIIYCFENFPDNFLGFFPDKRLWVWALSTVEKFINLHRNVDCRFFQLQTCQTSTY